MTDFGWSYPPGCSGPDDWGQCPTCGDDGFIKHDSKSLFFCPLCWCMFDDEKVIVEGGL